jgi:hypothetical protein
MSLSQSVKIDTHEKTRKRKATTLSGPEREQFLANQRKLATGGVNSLDAGRLLSVDLQNATYSMSHDIFHANNTLFDKAMAKFVPWKVFHKIFKIPTREVDVSQLQEQDYLDESLSPKFVTKSGIFMGDSMAFIHLTVTMLSLVEQALTAAAGDSPSKDVYRQIYRKRPLGQSVGDDMICLAVSVEFCDSFKERAQLMGLVVTKIHSKSEDSGTFCENYVVRFPKGTDLSTIPQESLFGDLVFLDSLKGSVFSGKSKVKQDGSDPFLGHAKLLQKQLEYLPKKLGFRVQRAKTLLWSRHFSTAAKLSRALPSLPSYLGGIGIAVGRQLTITDASMEKSYLPYYYGMLREPNQELFLTAQELLLGIFRTSNKGFPWDPLEIDLLDLLKGLKTSSKEEVLQMLPAYAENWTISAKIELLDRKVGYVPLSNIGAELIRRQAFLKWWLGEVPPKRQAMLSLKGALIKERHQRHWDAIREFITPATKPFDVKSLHDLENKLKARSYDLFFRRDDPALKEAFFGMPSMHMVF